jgi:transposase
MWKPEHRRAADRHGLHYPSDLSDSEWALIEPAIPPAKRGGRRREVNLREVLNAIFYVLSTGCSISRNRRLARDFKRYSRTVAAFVRLAMIRVMLRRLTRPCHSTLIATSRIGS